MEIKQIKELMQAMEELDISELNWRDGDCQVQLKRTTAAILTPTAELGEESPARSSRSLALGGANLKSVDVNPSIGMASSGDEGVVRSPMVGTCYLTPAPNRPPYVNVGDEVNEESVVCVIEAMKVMNEIRAPRAGKVVEISIESGNPVEFGSHLMRIS